MELNVHEKTKIVEIWLTNAEKNNPAVQAQLKNLFAKYKKRKFTVAVFCSGSNDLYPSIRDMLVYNKKRCAEQAVQRVQRPARTFGAER